MSDAHVASGAAMTPEQEAEHKQRLREMYAVEAEDAVAVIEAKLAGMQQSLHEARKRAVQLRAQADAGEGEI